MLIPLFSFSQDCKFKKNEIDSFTGDTLLATKFVRLNTTFYGDNSYYIAFGKENSKHYLIVKYYFLGQKVIFVDQENPIMFKFNNDSIISFYPVTNYSGDILKKYTSFVVYYSLNKSQLKYFSENNIKSIRMYFSEFYKEKAFNNIEKIEKVCFSASCILK